MQRVFPEVDSDGPLRGSLIVVSHRPASMEKLAPLLIEQQRAAPRTEVIVVADYPVDALAAAWPRCTWRHLPARSISRKRNAGIKLAKGNVCAFLDDDCTPDPGWFQKGLLFLERDLSCAGVEGKTRIEQSQTTESRMREYKRLEKPGYRTNNIFYRREALLRVGMFDERFAFQREDLDCAFTLLEAGYRIAHDDALTVEHAFRPSEPWDLLKNCWNRRFDPLLHKKHPRPYRQTVGSPVPPVILAVGLCHLVFILSSFRRRRRGVAGGLDLSVTAAGLLYRNRGRWNGWRDAVAFVSAPFVLGAALLWGSLRSYHLLLV